MGLHTIVRLQLVLCCTELPPASVRRCSLRNGLGLDSESIPQRPLQNHPGGCVICLDVTTQNRNQRSWSEKCIYVRRHNADGSRSHFLTCGFSELRALCIPPPIIILHHPHITPDLVGLARTPNEPDRIWCEAWMMEELFQFMYMAWGSDAPGKPFGVATIVRRDVVVLLPEPMQAQGSSLDG
jgi:hypothetical protein